MPVLVALPLGLCLGVSFAWLSRRELRRVTSELGSRGLAIAALFGLFVLAPVSAYFLAFEPDWCLAYLLDTSQATPALAPALVVVALATVPSGFLFGRWLLERDEATLLRALLALVVATLGAIMLGLRRFAVQGSYAQFHGDFGTQPLAGSSLGYAILVLGFWLTAGLVFAVWNLRRLD
ncbi:MAG: hypothetical protein EOO73_32635 [Myxococcales bacterium]|nr:MAG: hypothetical protein EOO73_32635 [Myxococcales bacterium]